MTSTAARPPDHGGHGHRTWLHLLPSDPQFTPDEGQLAAAAQLLVDSELARPGPEPLLLLPGPSFARLLGTPGELLMAGPPRGEIRLAAGVLRCYPDPGPEGFDTEPPQDYRGGCPSCGGALLFFRLRFPYPEPLEAQCPGCGARVDLGAVDWSPRLPLASAELTFGDLRGRPSLRGTDLVAALEQLWACSLLEVHVTL